MHYYKVHQICIMLPFHFHMSTLYEADILQLLNIWHHTKSRLQNMYKNYLEQLQLSLIMIVASVFWMSFYCGHKQITKVVTLELLSFAVTMNMSSTVFFPPSHR